MPVYECGGTDWPICKHGANGFTYFGMEIWLSERAGDVLVFWRNCAFVACIFSCVGILFQVAVKRKGVSAGSVADHDIFHEWNIADTLVACDGVNPVWSGTYLCYSSKSEPPV